MSKGDTENRKANFASKLLQRSPPPLNFTLEKEGYAISRNTIQDSRSQGVNQPWEMTYIVIFQKAFNFPIVSTTRESETLYFKK